MIKSIHIAAKDLRSEFRTKQMINSMFIFSLLVIVIFSIALGELLSRTDIIDRLAPAVLWVSFVFAGTLGLSRAFGSEMDNGCLEGLKLCPMDRGAIYTGKAISSAVIMFLVEAVTIPIFVVLFNYDINGLAGLSLVIVLGTFGFIVVGTLLSALTVSTRAREIMLPILLLPLVIPVLIPAVTATGKLLTDGDIGDIYNELQLLIVYDLIFFTVGHLVFEFTVQD
jgi:heme exporter protein B